MSSMFPAFLSSIMPSDMSLKAPRLSYFDTQLGTTGSYGGGGSLQAVDTRYQTPPFGTMDHLHARQTSGGGSGSGTGSGSGGNSIYFPSDNQAVIKKLNYLIQLAENQSDIRTESVPEEIILYSFLGVFIIFLVDSFVRVGKYVR